MKNNLPIPTLELKHFIAKNLLNKYQNLFFNRLRWILCEEQIKEIDRPILDTWLEYLYVERLKQKVSLIKELLVISNNNFEAVLFQLLAKNFGLKVNADAFLKLATSLDFSVVRKSWFKEESLMALLFGQGGFLEENIEEGYYQKLKEEYKYLQYKFNLKPMMAKREFQFFRMRPANFPTIRIAQLASLYIAHQNLFSKLIQLSKLEDFYKLLSVEINDFWKTHYTFEVVSKKSAKKITKPFIDLLLLNTIIPLKFEYLAYKGQAKESNFFNLIKQIKPEKNSIISKFSKLEINAKNAFESQALLQLKSNYCELKQCLQCAIGRRILKKN